MTGIIEGVDYSTSRPSPIGLYDIGKRFALRYIGPGSTPKHLLSAERDELFSAGLAIGALAEGMANAALDGAGRGRSHAQSARQHGAALELPENRPIYFAVDFDVNANQWPAVADYLRGAADVLGVERIGIYGSIHAIEWAHRDGLAQWFFQTYAWSSGQWSTHCHLQQYKNGVYRVGGDLDLVRAVRPDYGQWAKKGTHMTTLDDTYTEPDGRVVAYASAIRDTLRAVKETRNLAKSNDVWLDQLGASVPLDLVERLDRIEEHTPPADGELLAAIERLSAKVDQLADSPLIDAVAVAAAIGTSQPLLDAIAAGVALRLAGITGSLTLTGSLSGRITPPAA